MSPPTAPDKKGWVTDSGENAVQDAPGTRLQIVVTNGKLDPVQIDWVDLEQSFSTYVMYNPAGQNSKWVALQSVEWKIRSRAKAQIVGPNNGKWVSMPPGWGASWDVIPSFGPATAQPEWNHQYGLGQDLM